jgi:ADP-ribosylglycohydrolase
MSEDLLEKALKTTDKIAIDTEGTILLEAESPGKFCLGAICGDYIGSRFEFDPVSGPFDLIHEDCFFTDDSILSLAVEETVRQAENPSPAKQAENPSPADFERVYRGWFKRFSTYHKAGWGAGFYAWADDEPGARTNSFGNGAIMRVSAVANVCMPTKDRAVTERQRAIEIAHTSCMPTHSHPRSIDAAKTLVELISYAKEGKGVSEILPLARHRGYTILPYEEELRSHGWTVEVKETLEAALSCLEGSRSYEEAVTRAINLRGDADTTAAVVGSLAEHLWGVPKEIEDHVLNELTKLLNQYPERGNTEAS